MPRARVLLAMLFAFHAASADPQPAGFGPAGSGSAEAVPAPAGPRSTGPGSPAPVPEPAGPAAPASPSASASGPRDPDILLFTAGIGLPAPSAGVKLRLFHLFEAGARLGGLPTLWTAEVDANILWPNPDPAKGATWYGGLEYLYYHEDGAGGRFRTGYLDVLCGREQRFTPRFRWALEAGLAFQLFQEFHGGGAPISFPILPVTRAELRYAVF